MGFARVQPILQIPAMTDSQPVGLIGLGLMGRALTHRLTGAGLGVLGFDIDPGTTARLAEIGGRPAGSIAAVARAAAPIILAVFDTDQVEEVVEAGLLPEFGDGSG